MKKIDARLNRQAIRINEGGSSLSRPEKLFFADYYYYYYKVRAPRSLQNFNQIPSSFLD